MISSDARVKSLFHQALAARSANDLHRAAALFRQVLQEAPGFAPAYVELGLLIAGSNDHATAEACLLKAVELAPADANCAWALADFYSRHEDWPRARHWFEYAIRLAPENAMLAKGLLRVLQSQGDYGAALKLADLILLAEPDNLNIALIRGFALDELGEHEHALSQFDRLLLHDSAPAVAVARWARLMVRMGRVDELVARLRERLSTKPGNRDDLHMLSSACIESGRYVEAEDVLLNEHRLRPTDTRVMYELGVVARILGKFKQADQWFEKVLEQDSGHAAALRLLGERHKYEERAPSFLRLRKAEQEAGTRPLEDQAQLHYALGKAYDDIGDFSTSFRHYIEGGRLRRLQFPGASDALDSHLAFIRTLFRDGLPAADTSGCESDKPVFIIGMPRSGTTLIEQMLASHPEVFGAGELTCLEKNLRRLRLAAGTVDIVHRRILSASNDSVSCRMSGVQYVSAVTKLVPCDVRRVVDKMPGNFLWAGFIPLILPNARIIHCRRHPVEICLSAFKTYFTDGHLYSYDLGELGRYYRRYEEIMAIWRQYLPGNRFVEVRYEDVVKDYETQARMLIDFIGMGWNEACVDFHSNSRPVGTASANQVRQPLYSTSLNRWRKYQDHLSPLLDELQELIGGYEESLHPGFWMSGSENGAI